ncbi:MAG: HAD family hydrolase, partial [Angelakisella sp.]
KIDLFGSLADSFCVYGGVSVVIGEKDGNTLDVVLWIMSCRVLKRGMEAAMLDALVAAARRGNISTLRGHYYPTAKNGMVREFYGELGFTRISADEEGNSLWELPLDGYTDKNNIIKVV